MGINGLWELLAPAATTTSLHSLALTNRFRGAAPHAPYTIGVDVSIWFEQCQQSSWFRAHPRSGQNPALRSFIYRVAHLARLPINVIFCYDGKERPTMKRNKKVLNLDHWMVRPTQRILDAFNIQWVMARSEAEAELSLMNKEGVIDAVMTDDSDAFVFGAQTVLQNSTLSSDDTVKIYTADAIRQRVAPSLQREGFVLMAVCCGGDYDKTGLYGCGQSTALGLVRCGLAHGLCSAVSDVLDVADSLCVWRRDVREHLACDPTQQIGRLYPALAHTLPDTFPEPNIVTSYLHPVVTGVDKLPTLLGPQPPNVPALAALTQELLGWEDPGKMLTMFQSTIWPAVVLKEMLLDLSRNSVESNEIQLATGCTRSAFLAFPRSRKVVLGISGTCVEVSTASFVGDTLSVMSAAAAQRCNDVKPGKLRVWVPDCIFKCWQDTMFPVSSPLAHVSQGASSSSSSAPRLPSINVPLGSANSSNTVDRFVPEGEVIDLCDESDFVLPPGPRFIDLTGVDAEVIDLTEDE
ncbi:hypothetical protein PAXINDRAFT_102221 [Paxillus involutus ATCC 200175]|uniref:XPG-I domain-containing protein n=1 Tax=Paxillus involutus ATCC 200175 TaxID=664439 RepID=A0A0C9TQY0_PAXIN|nr:hypothetical protein PAXINDRAFT_102221 [Paxillus involutus ATCC 200175]